jgi:ribosomal protein S18 acetylase RimI-like enzyme
MGIVVRRGTIADTPEMLRLWREMMDVHAQADARFRPRPSPAGEQAMGEHLRKDVWDSEDWCVFVAEDGERLVGQIVGMMREPYPVFEPGRHGYVTDVVVDEAARAKGVGRALFEALKVWFRARGADHIKLQVAHHNRPAQAFWRALGCTDFMHTLWYDLEAG